MKNQLTLALLLMNLTNANASFIAHEWGTFTSLVGSDGVTVNGMYHEDEVLPDFVHGFGEVQKPASIGVVDPTPNPVPTHRPCRLKSCFDDAFYDQNVITQKMETPVIYFYENNDNPLGIPENVEVNVRFPEGLITETYPAPVSSFPQKSDMPVLGNGSAKFQVRIEPTTFGKLRYVEPENIYSHARNVASNLVSSGQMGDQNYEEEKFIFYRGLGRFQPKIDIFSNHGFLNFRATQATQPQAAFLVHVNESGDAQMINLGAFTNRNISEVQLMFLKNHDKQMSNAIARGEAIRNNLIVGLVSSGLNQDEAVAMIDTWEHGYLKTPGLRLLYVLPQAEVDEVLPLSMSPAPTQFNRVFVGRIEIMTVSEEQSILVDILMNPKGFQVSSLGRFAEAKLRRVSQVYREGEVSAGRVPNQNVVGLIENLISTAAHMTSN